MQKKLEAELKSIAHGILRLKSDEDIKLLTDKAHQLYQKLSVLSYIHTYVKETPQNSYSVKDLEEQYLSETPNTAAKVVDVVEPIEEIVVDTVGVVKDVDEKAMDATKVEKEADLTFAFEKEFKNTIALDQTSNLFENAKRVSSKSINELIMSQKNLQIDLNDRIAFVKNLFENSQEDFNRVVSQLNSMESESEALEFLKLIKKDYDWTKQEELEERLRTLIERKFS